MFYIIWCFGKRYMVDDSHWISSKEAASLLLISPVTLRQWAQKGKVRSQKTLGGHRRFLKQDILSITKGREINPVEKSASNSSKTILIVDDNEDFLEMLLDSLSENYSHWRFEKAIDGFSAGLKVKEYLPDILLIDLHLPGLSGDNVCAQLKDNPAHKNLRIIGMTGYVGQDSRSRFVRAGAEAVLEKPIDMKELFQLVEM